MGYVLDFADGDKSMRDLLGGKGAGLAEMTKLGLAVPPGFTITTEACRYVMEHGEVPTGLWEEVDKAIGRLEETTGVACAIISTGSDRSETIVRSDSVVAAWVQ